MSLTVPEEAREPLVQELARFATSMPDPEARHLYRRLLEAVTAGTVDTLLDEPLGRFLEVALQTGRIRQQYGPHEEKALRTLYHQTQRGRQILDAIQQANKALCVLQGHTLRELAFTPQNPGTYRLTLATDQVRLTLEINAEGVWVETLTVG